MVSFIIFIAFVILVIYLANFRNDFDLRENQNKIFQRKIENDINDILKRLKSLENSEIKLAQKHIVQENVYSQEKHEDVIEPDEPQVADMTQYAQEIEEAIENNTKISPQQQIAPKAHIEKAVPHSSFVSEGKQYQAQKSDSFDLEKFFLGNMFSKIGGIALVLAICFLVKLSSQYIEFTPFIKITMGYIVSVAFLMYSLFLYNKENTVTAQILSGVAISGLLLSTYFGCFFYELFTIPAALSVAFMIALSSYFISLNFNSFSTIAIGLFGGYLNPAVFYNDTISPGVLFGYLIALNLISVSYTYKNGSKNVINCINILLTVATLGILSTKDSLSVVFPILLWLLYVIYDILTTLKKSKQSNSTVLRWFNFGALIYIVNHIFHFSDKLPIGLTILVVGLIYGILYFVFRNENEDVKLTNLQSGLICLLAGTFYLVEYPYLALAWTVEGFLVSEIYIKLRKPFLRNYTFLFFFPAFIYLFLNYKTMFPSDSHETLTLTLFLYIAQALILLYSAKRIEKTDVFAENILKMLGFSVIYLYIVFFANTGNTDNWTKLYIDVIISCIYSFHSYKILSKEFKDFGLIFSEVLYGLSIILLTIAELLSINNTHYIPFFNLEFLAYITLLGLSAYYHRAISTVFGYLSVVLGMFALVGQIYCLFAPLFPADTMPIVITTSLIIYSGVILTVGILNNTAFMKQTSICLILILLVKLLLIDLHHIDAVFKLIAFVIIGIILIGVSSYYQKRK